MKHKLRECFGLYACESHCVNQFHWGVEGGLRIRISSEVIIHRKIVDKLIALYIARFRKLFSFFVIRRLLPLSMILLGD